MDWICMYCGSSNDLASSTCIACEKRPPVVWLYITRFRIRYIALCQKLSYVALNSILCTYICIKKLFSGVGWLRYSIHAISALTLMFTLVCVGLYWHINMPDISDLRWSASIPAISELYWQVSTTELPTLDIECIAPLSDDKLIQQLKSNLNDMVIHTVVQKTECATRVKTLSDQLAERVQIATQSTERFVDRCQQFTMVDAEFPQKKNER